MFRHILIPTDGSECAERAIAYAVHMARSEGSTLTAVAVQPTVRWAAVDGVVLPPDVDETGDCANEASGRALRSVSAAAEQAGVTCKALVIERDQPSDGILAAAEQVGADLIVMASHGRRGVSALILGSETQQVLTRSTIPVLVVR